MMAAAAPPPSFSLHSGPPVTAATPSPTAVHTMVQHRCWLTPAQGKPCLVHPIEMDQRLIHFDTTVTTPKKLSG
jgi:hypothetical protein